MAGLVGMESAWAQRGFACAAVVLLSVINVAGVKWVVKLQFVLLLILLFAGIDFIVGSFTHIDASNSNLKNIRLIIILMDKYLIFMFFLCFSFRGRFRRLVFGEPAKQHIFCLRRWRRVVHCFWCFLPNCYRGFGWDKHEWWPETTVHRHTKWNFGSPWNRVFNSFEILNGKSPKTQ